MTQLHQKSATVAKRNHAGSAQTAATTTRKTVRPRKAEFSPEVFASEAAYDQSVASVVARIQSGQVTRREPDE